MGTNTDLESSLEHFFVKRIRLVGGRTYKFIPVEKGLPDRIVLMPGGHIYFVELKAHTGKVSPIQVIKHAEMARLGTRVFILSSREQIVAWIKSKIGCAPKQKVSA